MGGTLRSGYRIRCDTLTGVAADWILIADASRPVAESPVSPRRVIGWLAAIAVVVILAVALVGVVAARHLAEVEAVSDASKTADVLAESVVQPVLTDAMAAGDAASISALADVVTSRVLSSSLVRVKIWTADGTIIYSDEARLIGRHFDLGADEQQVLKSPQTRADVSDLDEPENEYERSSGKLLEVYRPIWTPSGDALLFETYFRYDDVDARSADLWRGFAGITLASILVLLVLLVPLLWRLLESLGRARVAREALLRKALDSSANERRRIAGTLHDGVVQDLVATSFAVGGAAEKASASGDTESAADLRFVAGTVRSSIGGLRSLLVDIYPPSLAESGLAAALDDLVAGARGRNVDVAVTSEVGGSLDALPLDAAGQRLVFRVAQECLANIAKHAAATRVTLTFSRTATAVVMELADDGVGFDAAARLASPEEGHFGLRLLGDVVTEAGGRLELRTTPGEGTTWRLTVPAA